MEHKKSKEAIPKFTLLCQSVFTFGFAGLSALMICKFSEIRQWGNGG
jgi:hypothetical protein